MIGNDIIDLQLARKNTRITQERYWRKVLTEVEIFHLKKQADVSLAFLLLWAAKEATYKLASKIHGTHLFSPKSIVIKNCENIHKRSSTYVSSLSPLGITHLKLKATSYTVEAYAASDLHLLEQAIFQQIKLPGSTYKIQSQATQEQLVKNISQFLSIPIEKISIQKENSIPKLYLSRKKSPIDITLSHHGRWGAFGYTC